MPPRSHRGNSLHTPDAIYFSNTGYVLRQLMHLLTACLRCIRQPGNAGTLLVCQHQHHRRETPCPCIQADIRALPFSGQQVAADFLEPHLKWELFPVELYIGGSIPQGIPWGLSSLSKASAISGHPQAFPQEKYRQTLV